MPRASRPVPWRRIGPETGGTPLRSGPGSGPSPPSFGPRCPTPSDRRPSSAKVRSHRARRRLRSPGGPSDTCRYIAPGRPTKPCSRPAHNVRRRGSLRVTQITGWVGHPTLTPRPASCGAHGQSWREVHRPVVSSPRPVVPTWRTRGQARRVGIRRLAPGPATLAGQVDHLPPAGPVSRPAGPTGDDRRRGGVGTAK